MLRSCLAEVVGGTHLFPLARIRRSSLVAQRGRPVFLVAWSPYEGFPSLAAVSGARWFLVRCALERTPQPLPCLPQPVPSRRSEGCLPPGHPVLRSISPEGSISHCRAPRFPSSPSTSRPSSAFESVAGLRRLSHGLPDPPLGLGSPCCSRSERRSMRSCRSVRALSPGLAGHLSERPVSFVPKDSRSSGSCLLPVRWPKSSLLGRTGWSTSSPFRATPWGAIPKDLLVLAWRHSNLRPCLAPSAAHRSGLPWQLDPTGIPARSAPQPARRPIGSHLRWIPSPVRPSTTEVGMTARAVSTIRRPALGPEDPTPPK